MDKQTFKKCAIFPIEDSFTIPVYERAVARVFSKIRMLLEIPYTTKNIYEYLSELITNCKQQKDSSIYHSVDSSSKIDTYNKNKEESLDLIKKLEQK